MYELEKMKLSFGVVAASIDAILSFQSQIPSLHVEALEQCLPRSLSGKRMPFAALFLRGAIEVSLLPFNFHFSSLFRRISIFTSKSTVFYRLWTALNALSYRARRLGEYSGASLTRCHLCDFAIFARSEKVVQVAQPQLCACLLSRFDSPCSRKR